MCGSRPTPMSCLMNRAWLPLVDIQWEFDEFYSLTAVEGLDTDGNGSYEASELRPLAEENITSLQEYGYFVVVRSGADKVALGTVTEFESYLQGRTPEPAFSGCPWRSAGRSQSRSVQVFKTYDPSFYIAIELAAKNALGAIGTSTGGLHFEGARAGGRHG